MLLHEVDKVVVHLALDLVQDGDTCRATIHAKGPPDFLRKLAAEMPPSTSNFRLIDLDRPVKPQIG